MGLALKNINAKRSSGRSATNFDSSVARDRALLFAARPGLSPHHEGIERPPVARQHPVVHASAAIDEQEDLGPASGTHDLRLPTTRAGQREHGAEDGQHAESTPQRSRQSAPCDLPAARPDSRTAACRGGCATAAARPAATAAEPRAGQDRGRRSSLVPLLDAAQLGAQLADRQRTGRESRAEKPLGRLVEELLDPRTQRCEVRRLPEQIRQRCGLYHVPGGAVERPVQREPGFRRAILETANLAQRARERLRRPGAPIAPQAPAQPRRPAWLRAHPTRSPAGGDRLESR